MLKKCLSFAGIFVPLDGINDAGVSCGIFMSYQGKDGQVVPSYKAYNFLGGPGYTFDDEKTNAELEVHDALVIKDGGTTYNYINENSKLVYKGKFRKVTLFVRVYDDFNGDNNKRWVAINLK